MTRDYFLYVWHNDTKRQGDQMELMKMAKKPLIMPIYWMKVFKIATSGHPDQSELMKNGQKSQFNE